MSYDPRVACLFNALTLAMQAKVADVDGMDVEELVTEAGQVLEATSPERAAINTFATQYELHSFDAARVIALGDQLLDAINRALRPDPAGAERSDIYG